MNKLKSYIAHILLYALALGLVFGCFIIITTLKQNFEVFGYDVSWIKNKISTYDLLLVSFLWYFILRYWYGIYIGGVVSVQRTGVAFGSSTMPGSTRSLNFSTALCHLKEGKRVAREGWSDLQWLSVSNISTAEVKAENFWSPNNAEFARENGGTATVLPCITVKTVQDAIQMGWTPSQSDLFAHDWCVLD